MNKYFQAASGTWGDFQLFHLVLSAAVADCVYLHFALQLSSSDPPVSRPRTTGPLGMGISNAVGLAAAEAHLAAVPWRSTVCAEGVHVVPTEGRRTDWALTTVPRADGLVSGESTLQVDSLGGSGTTTARKRSIYVLNLCDSTTHVDS